MTRANPAEKGPAEDRSTLDRPPVTLAFLAPAEQCNQRCLNCYITDVGEEPVHSFDLEPDAFAVFVRQFLDEGIPILSVKFQGFEVTLPRSWPYLEAVFRLAQARGVRRSFVTNGMLLHKWANRVEALDIARISISVDGSSAEVNDRFRGLSGAFEATTKSVARFISAVPSYRDRLVVASLLRPGGNFESLLKMPELLQSLGVQHWVVSVELGMVEGKVRPLLEQSEAIDRLGQLQRRATEVGISVHVSDEYGSLSTSDGADELNVHTIPEQRFFYRFYPTGDIHIGKDVFGKWSSERVVRWQPSGKTAPEVVRYRKSATDWANQYAEAR